MLLINNDRNTGPVAQGSSQSSAQLAAMVGGAAQGSSQGACFGPGSSQVHQGSTQGPAHSAAMVGGAAQGSTQGSVPVAAMVGGTARGSSSFGPVAQGSSQGSSRNPGHVLAMRGGHAPDPGASLGAQGPAPGPFRAPHGVPEAPQAPYHHPAVPRPRRRNRPARTIWSNHFKVGSAVEDSFDEMSTLGVHTVQMCQAAVSIPGPNERRYEVPLDEKPSETELARARW
ncbi:Protein CBG26652 [Caenorhabditis briggsae]|uniref:Protein CBG26652 n=1 Tax=Caenorhabditis briggsae TaxID=6238 RepID=B6IE13_CAEBR|nr:Protein CBG26652 [Caenorhabditis briggsae]CAS01077.1 Protein CBG26652 [Caenorhabditis briggsae]